MAELIESVVVAAPQQAVWDRFIQWESQGDWMLLTRVRTTSAQGHGVGAGLEGWTGIGRLGFLDTMTIRVWEPPVRCVVRHTGRFVRGSGAFEITDLGDGRSRFTWSEWLDLPLGMLGRVGWLLVRPVMRLGVQASLRRFARSVEAAARP